MQVFTYPKVLFDSWIIDPVRNRSASFSVGLPRIGGETCEVSVFEIKSHSRIVEKIAFFSKYKAAEPNVFNLRRLLFPCQFW
jgi:hypothetical protein